MDVAYDISIIPELSLTVRLASIISTKLEMTGAVMQSPVAIDALGALAQEHRLALFRLLVQAGQGGRSAGSLAEALAVPNSSLSFHLAHLNERG